MNTNEKQLFIEISDDEMQVKVTLVPPEEPGLPPVTLERIRAALDDLNIHYGILEENLSKLEIHLQRLYEPNQVHVPVEVVVARGKPVVHGTDAYLEKYYDHPKELTPPTPGQVENETARVDYRNVSAIQNVEKGTVLCKLIPSTQGEMGITVTGKQIQPAVGRDLVIKVGPGVALDAADPNIFIATETGQVVLKGDTISVLAIYEVNGDLTMKIGNIDFLGTVLIHGSVNGEFKIKAGQDVFIDGVLDGGEVTAGGSVNIKGGVIGAKTRVIADGDVSAKYVRNAYVESGSVITIYDTSIHSTLTASNKIVVTGRGHLVGGTSVAGWEVNAKEIGARSNTPTDIEVGEDPRLREELKRLEPDLKNFNEQLDKTKKSITFLKDLLAKSGTAMPDEKKEMLNKLTRTQFKILADLKQLQTRKSEIESKAQEFKSTGRKRAKVSCQGIIYPGTKIMISRVSKAISMENKFSSFIEENGQIKSIPYS